MTLEKLVGISSPALTSKVVDSEKIPVCLRPLIEARNGFYAFASALFVRPWGGGVGSAEWWNTAGGWGAAYGESVDGLTFFAEDVFGFQFAVDPGGVHLFNPETAQLERMAASVEEWADQILANFNELTGYTLAQSWQSRNGPLKPGFRLAPSVPFILGGRYEVADLKEQRDLELARIRAHVHAQIKDLPDGAQVKITLI